MKAARLCFVLGALPLLGYPFVLIGALFWLASLGNLSAPSARAIAALCLAGTTQLLALAYPLVLAHSFNAARSAQRDGDEAKALGLSFRPLAALGAVALLGILWAIVGG